MKKKLLYASVFAAMLSLASQTTYAQSTPASASTTIYDFSKFADADLLEFFAKLIEQGRKYPTKAELQEQGIWDELEFVRSHVRKRNILDREDRLNKSSISYKDRNLFMNIPAGAGSTLGGYPSKDFASDNYSMWNYTHLFGAWNHGLFQAPGSWADAAHKNGTDMLSGMKFFDTTGGRDQGSSGWINVLKRKNPDGTYRYAKPLVYLLQFLGLDGINYNWEASGYGDTDVIGFHQECYKIAKAEKFDNFHIMMYTNNSSLPSWGNMAAGLWGSNGNRTTELMLNYVGSDFAPANSANASVNAAKSILGTADGLYMSTWIVSMNRSWTNLTSAPEAGVCLWGEHGESRFWSYNTGGDGFERIGNYQMLLERGFSGGFRNPLNRPEVTNSGHNWEWSNGIPPLNTFPGLATWIPERTAINHDLPFYTGFNMGNGERYNYKGKKTAGSWYNLGNQDVVPTYRWLVVSNAASADLKSSYSTAIQPEFTNKDAYTGGSCLLLTGKSTASQTDIVLYKTKLKGTNGNIYAKVAVKTGKEGNNDSKLYLIVRTGNTWKEYAVGNTTDKTWTEKTIQLDGINSGDEIDRIGLRVKNSDDKYSLMVGKLEINDNIKTTPSNVSDLTIQVKEETTKSLSVKASWGVDKVGSAENALVYNDEANIDHFEILYKNGENGDITEIARTTQWATYVGDIELPNETDKPFIGVRAASTDLKTYSPIVWQEVPREASASLPNPSDKYGPIELDGAANGADIARKVRYIEQFKTEGGEINIDYTANKPAGNNSNYVDATNQVLKVAQGQTVTLKFKGYKATDEKDGNHDDLRWCMGKGWLDLNGDYQFNPDDISINPTAGECLFNLGTVRKGTIAQVEGLVSKTFTIPADAKTGVTRMRIVFSDAWFAGALLPTGKFNKGFAIDFKVEITGTNPERVAIDTHDKGKAEQPEGLNEATNITNFAGKASRMVQNADQLNFENVEKAWIYTVDGQLMQTLVNPTTVATTTLAKGVYLVKMQNKNIMRTVKLTVK